MPRFIIPIAACLVAISQSFAADPAKPNIVFILADDLGSAEVGCYGQKKIHTPNIDRLAAEGMRFTRFYTGNAVCAPSRCCLMTGKHPGHAFIRDNKAMKPEGQYPIAASEVTLATLLKARAYATAAIGKWGLGQPGTPGDPNKHGFDLFFGYHCQAVAHNYYPKFLRRNDVRIDLEGNDGGDAGKQYSHDLMEAEALKFIEASKDKPFFLYVPFTIPHLALQVPEDSLAEYKGKFPETPYKGDKGYRPHATPRAAYAAMITRLDRSVGRIVAKLKELGLEGNTLVIFSSDNGPTHGGVGGSDSTFFESAGNLRGLKGDLYEGGIRTPFVARWPGKIKAGTTSDLIAAFWDILPTLCDLAGAQVPKGIDGLSILPTLLGKGAQKQHKFLYWEFPGYGGQQAARLGDWKGIRTRMNKGNRKIELYNLASDPSEKNDVAALHPEIVAKVAAIFQREHAPSKVFPLKGVD